MILRAVHWVEDALTGVCVLIFLAALTLQVFFRYVFNNPLPWPEELAKFSFVWCCFFGAAAGTRRKAHVAVEVFVARLSPCWRHAVAALVHLGVLSVLALLVKAGLDLARLSSTSKLPAINLPLGYLVMALPIAAALMMLDFGTLFWESLRAWRNPTLAEPEPEATAENRSRQGA
jgi:TRAP-type C4-dicarboxylate transport system permease small subunit